MLFQPHRYTRTKFLLEEFASCFFQSDQLWVLDIYPASEPEIEGVTAELLVERVRRLGHRAVEYVRDTCTAVEKIVGTATEGDAVILLGAGNVNQVAEPILEKLRRN